MKTAHINAGNEFGGGLAHIVSLLKNLKDDSADLIVFEEGPVAEAARIEGIKVYVFAQKHRLDISILKRLRQFISEQDYAIIHTHGPRANTLIAMLHPFLKSIWVITVHSHPLLDFKERGVRGKLFETVHLKTFKKADGIITVSSEIKDYLKTLGAEDDRMSVIHNGITFTNFETKQKMQPEPLFTIITVGRLTKVKGYALLLDTLKKLDFHDWQWVVCGDGEEMTDLKRRAKEANLSQQVAFRGWLSALEIKQALQQADIFVLPSLSEGFPMILLEAANESVPAIATDVGDVREVVKAPTMGWLIPPKDSSELKKALSDAYALWQSNQLAEKGEQLNRWARHFSVEKQAQAVSEFYQEIIAKSQK